MKYDYIEIGISNTENLCQKYPDGIGITIEPLKFYFDRIKTSTNHVKLNISISDDNGKVAIFYVDPISFHQENSSLDSKITYGVKNPPSDILQYLTNIGRLDLLKSTVVDCIDWDTLVSRHDISDIDILKLNISSQNVELITSILSSESQIRPKEIYLYYNTYFEKEAILHKLESSGYRIVNQKNDEIHVKKNMKVDKIIFASDDNPTYLSYWEINAKVCREILEIEPVLFWITDEDSDFYHDGHGLVKKIKRLPDYIEEVWGQTFHSSGFQAQNVRLWGTKFFPEEVCLTSDIDLILFNREYIDENVRISDPEDMVIFNADGYDKIRPECVGLEFGPVRYPIPYISAKGKNFSKLLSCECSFKEYIQRLSLLNLGFGTDEFYMGMVVDNNKTDLVIHKNIRGASSYFYCNRRIERKHFRESVDNFSLDVLGYLDLTNYIDAHLPGPYEDYKEKVDNLLKYIFKKKNKKTINISKIQNNLDIFDKIIKLYAENNPDFFILNIGAMDGVMFDELVQYYDKYNFKGLYVEPIPYLFERLKNNFNKDGNIFENSAISKQDGILEMVTIDPIVIESGQLPTWYYGMSAVYPPKNGLGWETARDIVEKWGKIIEVTCITLENLLKKHKIEKYDVIKIDAEGHDWEIFQQIDIKKYRPKIIRLEWINLQYSHKINIIDTLQFFDYVFEIDGDDIVACPNEILI